MNVDGNLGSAASKAPGTPVGVWSSGRAFVAKEMGACVEDGLRHHAWTNVDGN